MHVYVHELKLKGQHERGRQFCKWCRGPVYIECTFTWDLGGLKNLMNETGEETGLIPLRGEMKEMD